MLAVFVLVLAESLLRPVDFLFGWHHLASLIFMIPGKLTHQVTVCVYMFPHRSFQCCASNDDRSLSDIFCGCLDKTELYRSYSTRGPHSSFHQCWILKKKLCKIYISYRHSPAAAAGLAALSGSLADRGSVSPSPHTSSSVPPPSVSPPPDPLAPAAADVARKEWSKTTVSHHNFLRQNKNGFKKGK